MCSKETPQQTTLWGAAKAIAVITKATQKFKEAYNDSPAVKAKLDSKRQEFENGLLAMQDTFNIGDHLTQAALFGVKLPKDFDRNDRKMMRKLWKEIRKAQIKELHTYLDDYAKNFEKWLKENNIQDRGTLKRIFDGLKAASES